MSKTVNFKTKMVASASGAKNLPLKEAIAQVLESYNEDGVSFFEVSEEEISDFEDEHGNQQLFFPSNIPTFFLDPVDALSLLHNFFQ